MTLDMGTLALAVGIAMVIRAVATTVQFAINREYPGIGLWALASLCSAAGFAFLLVRSEGSASLYAIVFQNGLIVLAVMLEYLGTTAFLGRPTRRPIALGGFGVFLIGLFLLAFVRDDITARTVLIHTSIAAFTFASAWALWSDRRPSIRSSTRFMSVVFLLSGGFYVTRAVMLLVGGPAESMLVPSAIQILDLLVAMIEGSLLTFGLIIMVGQRLHADATESKDRFKLLFNTSPDAAIISRLDDGVIASVNDGFSAMVGFTRRETIGASTQDMLWDDPAGRRELVARLAADGSVDNLEAVFKRKDGTRFVGMVSSKQFEFEGATHVISVIRDITERKALENELTLRATTDALTGLTNRGRFMELAHAELQRAQRHRHPLSIAILDIDHFKRTNDTRGHLVGDAVLVALGTVLQEAIRSIDVLARLGGDEFVVLMPETGARGAFEVAERIRSSVESNETSVGGAPIHTSVCLGVATLRGGDEPFDALLGRADGALYRAKQSGRNRVESESTKG